MLQDAVQGDRHTGQEVTWYAGTTPKDLSGATITGTKTNTLTRATTALDGAFNVTDGPNGVFTWVYGAGDTTAEASYLVQFTATYPSDSNRADSSYDAPWNVRAKRTP